MHDRREQALVFAFLALGILLRILQGAATPYSISYDNHLEPIRILVENHRLARPDECWSCYQPPLFYLTGAAAGETVRSIATAMGADPAVVRDAAGKAVQFVSVIAGCISLLLCWRILVRTGPWPKWCCAAGVGLVAFLPGHIRMSAMPTNDVFTQMWMIACLLGVLKARQRGWTLFDCIVVGSLAGAATLSKAYGMVSIAFVLLACLGEGIRERESGEGQRTRPIRPAWQRLLFVGVTCLLVGGFPAARNIALFGRPIVDNFELFNSRQKIQPPSELGGVSFLSFRYLELLRHPWLHATTVASFPTELFARLWFDYSGFQNSLLTHKPWTDRRRLVEASHPGAENRAFFEEFLNYEESSTPDGFRWVGRLSYCVGLPLTLLSLAGLLIAALRPPLFSDARLMVVYLLGCLAIPVVQTVRLPIFSAMKSEFALGALGCGAWGLAWIVSQVPRRFAGITSGAILGLLVLAALLDAAYLMQVWQATWYY